MSRQIGCPRADRYYRSLKIPQVPFEIRGAEVRWCGKEERDVSRPTPGVAKPDTGRCWANSVLECLGMVRRPERRR